MLRLQLRYTFILGESAFDLDILPKILCCSSNTATVFKKGSVSVAVHSLGYIAETRRWLTLEINDWKLL